MSFPIAVDDIKCKKIKGLENFFLRFEKGTFHKWFPYLTDLVCPDEFGIRCVYYYGKYLILWEANEKDS